MTWWTGVPATREELLAIATICARRAARGRGRSPAAARARGAATIAPDRPHARRREIASLVRRRAQRLPAPRGAAKRGSRAQASGARGLRADNRPVDERDHGPRVPLRARREPSSRRRKPVAAGRCAGSLRSTPPRARIEGWPARPAPPRRREGGRARGAGPLARRHGRPSSTSRREVHGASLPGRSAGGSAEAPRTRRSAAVAPPRRPPHDERGGPRPARTSSQSRPRGRSRPRADPRRHGQRTSAIDPVSPTSVQRPDRAGTHAVVVGDLLAWPRPHADALDTLSARCGDARGARRARALEGRWPGAPLVPELGPACEPNRLCRRVTAELAWVWNAGGPPRSCGRRRRRGVTKAAAQRAATCSWSSTPATGRCKERALDDQAHSRR